MQDGRKVIVAGAPLSHAPKSHALRHLRQSHAYTDIARAGDLNIAKEPLDNCDWADSRLARPALMKAFVETRPDRAWFLDFLDAG